MVSHKTNSKRKALVPTEIESLVRKATIVRAKRSRWVRRSYKVKPSRQPLDVVMSGVLVLNSVHTFFAIGVFGFRPILIGRKKVSTDSKPNSRAPTARK